MQSKMQRPAKAFCLAGSTDGSNEYHYNQSTHLQTRELPLTHAEKVLLFLPHQSSIASIPCSPQLKIILYEAHSFNKIQ